MMFFSINHETHFSKSSIEGNDACVYCGNAMIPAKASGIPISSINISFKESVGWFCI
jgi:hypothetical protein